MKKLLLIGVILLTILCTAPLVSATSVSCQDPPAIVINNNLSINNLLSQVQWMIQQQSQAQSQHQHISLAAGTTSSWISDSSSGAKESGTGIQQWTQTYSRLLYPDEVLTFPVDNGSVCTVLAGLPIGFYTIGAGHGYYQDQVQTLEAVPTYDPIRHRMEFGGVVVMDRIDYWTMKARLPVSEGAAFCVVDNRAPMNGYTTIEVTITTSL
jgi:hypothetical protein